jgi:hypothetical protein
MQVDRLVRVDKVDRVDKGDTGIQVDKLTG